MLDVVCFSSHPDQRWYLKHALYGGRTLKELALNAVVEDFAIKKIQTSNLPHSLFREILTRKMYWFRNFKPCLCLWKIWTGCCWWWQYIELMKQNKGNEKHWNLATHYFYLLVVSKKCYQCQLKSLFWMVLQTGFMLMKERSLP